MIELDKLHIEADIPTVTQPLDVALATLAGGFDLTKTLVKPDDPQLSSLQLGSGNAIVGIRNDLPKHVLVGEAFQRAVKTGWHPVRSLSDVHILRPQPLSETGNQMASFVISHTVREIFGVASRPMIRQKVGHEDADVLAKADFDPGRKLMLRTTSLDALEQTVLASMSQHSGEALPRMSLLSLALVDDEVVDKLDRDLRKSFSAEVEVPGRGTPESYGYALDSTHLGADDEGETVFSRQEWAGLLDQFIEQTGKDYEGEIFKILEETSKSHNAEVTKLYMQQAAKETKAAILADPKTRELLHSDPRYPENVRIVLERLRAKFLQSSAVVPEMAGAYSLEDLIAPTKETGVVKLPLLIPNIALNALYERWRQDEDFHLVAFDSKSGMRANVMTYGDEALAATRLPSRLFNASSWVRFDLISTEVYKQIVAFSRIEGSISISI